MSDFSEELRERTGKPYTVLILVGILFLGIGILFLVTPHGEQIETAATVTDIRVYSSTDGWDYCAVLTFTGADGQTYSGAEFPCSSGTRVGDTLTVLYDSDNPMAVSSPHSGFLPYLAVAVGALCLIFGIRQAILPQKPGNTDEQA